MNIDWDNVPATEEEARALGCTCTWAIPGAINHFDPHCSILHRHAKVVRVLSDDYPDLHHLAPIRVGGNPK